MMLLVTNVEFSMAHFWNVIQSIIGWKLGSSSGHVTRLPIDGKLHIFNILIIIIFFKVSIFSFLFLEV